MGENGGGGNDQMTAPEQSHGPQSRPPRRNVAALTQKRLETAAAAYVARFDASSSQLRAVLMRRVRTAQRAAVPIVAAAEAVIDDIIARYTKAGVLDDARYAERKAGSLHRRGVSSRHIREKLKRAGIDRDGVDQALETTREELAADGHELDLRAALAFARRRRLGPFRTTGARDERRSRDLAALGRAGFALDIARQVIDADDPDALLPDGPPP